MAVLVFAAWRTWALLARDKILDWWRDEMPEKVVEFLECPYCAGFWCAGAWVTLWDETRPRLPGIVEWQAGWWACAAGVVIVELVIDHIVGE